MSKIEWTDKTWNPVTGCTKVSQGCKNCYAERIYERFNGKGSFKNIICHEDRLQHPLHWKKPSMVFVNSMSDLFHEDVPFEFIDRVFAVMALTPHHTYQVLTKRPERMVEWYQGQLSRICTELDLMADDFDEKGNSKMVEMCADASVQIITGSWPLQNVWIGVSVEDQKTADERIPLLLQVPAAVRFLSCEPLLAEINLDKYLLAIEFEGVKACRGVHWVIVGGESGPGARVVHPDWVRLLRDQCTAAGVSFFFKQWGENMPVKEHINDAIYTGGSGDVNFDNPTEFKKVGKKKAGRLLDGMQYDEMPVIKKY